MLVLLVLEAKGPSSKESKTESEFPAQWVNTVNEQGGFGAVDLGYDLPSEGRARDSANQGR